MSIKIKLINYFRQLRKITFCNKIGAAWAVIPIFIYFLHFYSYNYYYKNKLIVLLYYINYTIQGQISLLISHTFRISLYLSYNVKVLNSLTCIIYIQISEIHPIFLFIHNIH